MTKEEVQQIARNIKAFQDKAAPYDLYSDHIIKHLLLSPWFIEALIRRVLLLSPKCRIQCIQMRNEMNETLTHSFDKGVLKAPVLDSKLSVKYKEPDDEDERSIMVNVEVQKRWEVKLMNRLDYYAATLIRDQVERSEHYLSLHNVYTITLTCQDLVWFKDKLEQYLHFIYDDESLERTHTKRGNIQHVFLEVNKFDRNTDDVNRDGCLFEAFMYIAKRWSVLTEDMLVEIILTGGHMAEAAFQLSQLNTTLTDMDMWLAIDRQKKQEELALEEAKQEGKQEEKAAVARRMLSNGSDVEAISIATGLTPEEITKLADSATQ